MSLVYKYSYLFLCLIYFGPAEVAGQDTPVFDRLRATFENNSVFKADFTHEYNDAFTGEQQVTSGVIWVGKEQYKIESSNSVMLVDGEISRVYDSTKNRVIISDYIKEEDDFAPSTMLQGVDESYSVEEHQTENKQTVVELSSDDPFSVFSEVSIFLNASGIPVRIVAIDQVDNELITYFNEGEFLQQTPGIFQLQYPEGAEEIDLRHDS